jgi:hypothetical protein
MDQKIGQLNSERDNPTNIEMAYVWTFHGIVEKLNQLAHLPDNYREENFTYQVNILKDQIHNYLSSKI